MLEILEPKKDTSDKTMAEYALKIKRRIEVEQKLKEVTAPLQAKESRGFFRDILSDAYGVNIHCFQMAAWTVILVLKYPEKMKPEGGKKK